MNTRKASALFPLFLSFVHLSIGAAPAEYLDPALQGVSVKAPGYVGSRYEALVPDTLDLAERAKLAINAMTRTLDPARDYELYFIADFADSPPMQMLEASGIFVETKYAEALPLCRLMSGSLQNLEVEQILMDKYIHHTGKDGFVYFPVEGAPWRNKDPFGKTYAPEDPYAQSWTEGRAIGTMLVWHQRDGNPLWLQLCDRKVERFLRAGGKFDDAIRFKTFYTVADAGAPGNNPAPFGLIRYAKARGSKAALELARLYVNFLKARYFPGGKFSPPSHQWSTTASLIDMMEYAEFTNNHELMGMVHNAYEQLKSPEHGGNALVGFFGEGTLKDYPSSEGCCVAAMVQMALKFSIYGVGDYWDDADRYIRNMFTEMQLTDTDWVELRRPAELPQNYIQKIADQRAAGRKYPGMTDVNGVVDKCVGAWAGWALGNDGMCLGHKYNPRPYTFMHCCTGNCARVLYYAWDSILTGDRNNIRVNLLLNRASPWMDIDSYIPYSGRVDLKVKQPINKLEIRVPEWVKPDEASCSVNGRILRPEFRGRYAQIGGVRKGDVVVVTFPISSRQVKSTIGGIAYNLEIKGNEAIAINPQGKWWPFYQKDYYRQNQVRWVKRERFVSTEKIEW